MKNNAYLLLPAIAVAMLFSSCNSNKPEDSKKVAEEKNKDRFVNRAAEKDAQFLVDAATISLEEVGLGELAKTKGTNQDVKDLGAMMITDHEKALDEEKILAAKKSVTLPAAVNDKTKEDIGKFSAKTGKDFDIDYCDKMVDGHKAAISKFEKFAEEGQDAEIKIWASETLPTLRKHLEHAMTCREKCKKNK